MRAFLLYIDDWLASKQIAKMDAAEERGYLRLLMRAATEEDCGLPDDDGELAIYSKLGAQWNKPTADENFRIGNKTSGEKLRDCFKAIDGRLYNPRLLKEFLHQQKVQTQRQANGKRGGRPKKPDVNQMLSEMKANGNHSVSPEKANGKLMVSENETKTKANQKLTKTNDVWVSSLHTQKDTSTQRTFEEGQDEGVSDLTANSQFDYEAGFDEAFYTYPEIGRTKIEDSKRMYYERICHDPIKEHAELMASIRPGGKWRKSKKWDRGYIPGFCEFCRNRRWKENPESANSRTAADDTDDPGYIPPYVMPITPDREDANDAA